MRKEHTTISLGSKVRASVVAGFGAKPMTITGTLIRHAIGVNHPVVEIDGRHIEVREETIDQVLDVAQPLDLQQLLTGDPNRLRYITRYSTSLVLHRENVAEHSYYVAFYAMVLCHWVYVNTELDNDNINLGRVLQKCLLHDLDESRTGDFQRPFKYSNKDLKAVLDTAAKHEFRQAVLPLFTRDEGLYADLLTSWWVEAKDSTYEGRIISLADYLCVLSHLMGEVGAANHTVMQNYITLRDYAKTFDDERYDFIRPLVTDSHALLDTMIQQAGFGN